MPFFSIIIPSYNRAHIVTRAINSVLSQSLFDFEIIVVDDGSTDSTKETVHSILDTSIHYVYQQNKGVCAARNHGVSKASGEYFIFLDSDDYVTQDWLKDFYEIAKKNSPDFVFCDMKKMDIDSKQEKVIKALDPYSQGVNIENGLYMPGTFCVKSSFFKSIGGFDENLRFAEFTDFGFSCNKKTTSKFFTQKIGLIYEASLDGGSKNSQNKIDANLYIIKKHWMFFKKQPDILRLYYQNIGVAYFRLSDWSNARTFFWKAYLIQPSKLKTLIRFLISFYPDLAKKIIK